jgi:methionyl-tRNA formyltransferase
MKRIEPDLFVAVGYVRLLKEKVLSVPRMMAVNFHASLLPAYRGKHPVFWALRHGEKSAGLTVHVMDPHLDTGDILYQVRVRTRRRDTVTTLYDRIMAKSVGLVGRLVVDARDGRLHSRSQAGDGASYFSSTSEDDFRLDWSMDAETLRRWICTTPGKCFEGDGDDRTYFQDAELVHGLSRGKPGTLLGRTGIWKSVATGGGLIRVRETECL